MGTKKILSLVLVLATVLIFIAGCSRAHFKNYYIISLEQRDFSHTDKRVEKTVKVRRFRSNRMLFDSRIVYMENPVRVGYYDFDLWVMNLDNMLGNMFYDYLSNSGVFKTLHNFSDASGTDYYVTGYIGYIGEVTKQEGRFAKTDITISIYDRNNRLVWRKRYERLKEVELSQVHNVFMDNLVFALSSQVSEIFYEAVLDISAKLK